MATLTAARTAALPRERALGAGFDWLVVGASAWLLGGLYWDGWAHGYGLPDSFWTVWHSAFNRGYAAAAVSSRRRAAAITRASGARRYRRGYEAAGAGVVSRVRRCFDEAGTASHRARSDACQPSPL